MTSHRKIGEIVITLALAYMIFKAVMGLAVSIYYMSSSFMSQVNSMWPVIVMLCIYAIFLGLMIWGVRKREKISGFLFKDQSDLDVSGMRFEQVLRLVMLAAGIWMISGVVSQTANAVYVSGFYMQGRSSGNAHMTVTVISLIIKAGIAFELLRGAPWFIRLQARLVKRMEGKYAVSDEGQGGV